MGAIELISLAVSAAGTIAGAVQARKASKARKRAQAISTAQGQIEDRVQRRRAAKQERLRRARLVQSSENAGAATSSGFIGAGSALSGSLAAGLANQSSQALGAQGISAANQQEASARSRGANISSFTDLITGGLSVWDEARNE